MELSRKQKQVGNLKKDKTATFDVINRTKRGKLHCTRIKRTTEVSVLPLEINRNKAHTVLGHKI